MFGLMPRSVNGVVYPPTGSRAGFSGECEIRIYPTRTPGTVYARLARASTRCQATCRAAPHTRCQAVPDDVAMMKATIPK